MIRTLLRKPWPAFFALLFVSPALAQKPDEKKDDKKEAETKLIKAGEIAGEITHVEPGKGIFRVRVTMVYYEPNQGAMQAVLNARASLARARTADELANAQRELARASAQSMYNQKTTNKELNLETGDDMKVRLAQPKAEFDDMGNLKKLTAAEIAKLKGKDGLFDGEMSDLKNGLKVKVTLMKNRPVSKPKGRDDAGAEENKLFASKVIILAPAGLPPK